MECIRRGLVFQLLDVPHHLGLGMETVEDEVLQVGVCRCRASAVGNRPAWRRSGKARSL